MPGGALVVVVTMRMMRIREKGLVHGDVIEAS